MQGHLDPQGRLRMIDVGGKRVTRRRAVAACEVRMRSETLRLVTGGELPKGDVLAVAQVAAVQAAKRTPELIPGCHPVGITGVEVSFDTAGDALTVRAEVRGEDRTGFEMEALTACAVAALTVYDMVKGVDAELEISALRLESKEGGKSTFAPALDGLRAAVVTVSDSVSAGGREDRGGPAVRDRLEALGADIVRTVVVPDDRERIAAELRRLAEAGCDLVVTTGGTGVAPRDVTPEATLDVADRRVPGLAEAMRTASLRSTPHAMLSRAEAALIGTTLVLNLPGNPTGATECLDAVAPALHHAIDLARGTHPH